MQARPGLPADCHVAVMWHDVCTAIWHAEDPTRSKRSGAQVMLPDAVNKRGLFSAARAAIKRQLYEGFGRDRWQHADDVVGALGLGSGARVADLGAGGGYFTFRLADAVGPTGRVYA